MATFQTKYGTMSKTSSTTIQLSDSVAKFNGRFRRTGTLSLSGLISGAGGIDALDGSVELITNGNFDTDLSGWTTAGTVWSSGVAQMTASGGRRLEQAFVTIPGVTYTASVNVNNITNPTGNGAAMVFYTGANATGTQVSSLALATGLGPSVLSLSFTAITTTTYIYMSCDDTNDVATFDNVSVKALNPTLAPSTFYYVYSVLSSGLPKIIASRSVIKPPSFSSYKKVGAFYTDSTGSIFKVYSFGDVNKLTSVVRTSTANAILSDIDTILTSVSPVSAGIKDLNIVAGRFADVPFVYSMQEDTNDSGAFTSRIIGTPTTSTIRVANWGSATQIESEFYFLQFVKKGVDAIQPDWRDY